MTREELLKYIAPCALMCYTCSAYEKGAICTLSRQLHHYLEGMADFYDKNRQDQIATYKAFNSQLTEYMQGDCCGCRDKRHCKCSIEGCFILECTLKQGVDYCGQCNAFPCDKVKDLFEETVYNQWLQGGMVIKESGIEAYWQQNKDKPHYALYKKEK